MCIFSVLKFLTLAFWLMERFSKSQNPADRLYIVCLSDFKSSETCKHTEIETVNSKQVLLPSPNSSAHLEMPRPLHEPSLHVLAVTWLSGAVVEQLKKVKCCSNTFSN